MSLITGKLTIMPNDSTIFFYLFVIALILFISYIVIRAAVHSALHDVDDKFDHLITLYKAELRAKGLSENEINSLIDIEEHQVDYFKR